MSSLAVEFDEDTLSFNHDSEDHEDNVEFMNEDMNFEMFDV